MATKKEVKDPRLAKADELRRESDRLLQKSRDLNSKAYDLRKQVEKEKRAGLDAIHKTIIGKIYRYATKPEPGVYRAHEAFMVIKPEYPPRQYENTLRIKVAPYSLQLYRAKNANAIEMEMSTLLDPALFTEFDPKSIQEKTK